MRAIRRLCVRTRRARQDHGDVARTIADHGHGLLAQRGQNQFALGAVGQRLACLGIHDLRIEVIFEDVQALMMAAFAANARADDLGKSVDIECLDIACALNMPAHGVRPRLCAEDTGAQRQLSQVHAEVGGAIDEVQKIGWCTAHRRDAKVLHQHDLPVGVAAGCGDDRRAQCLSAIVRAEAAGEEAVPIGDLNNVSAMQPASGQTADEHRSPYVDVILCVGNDDGLTGRSTRCASLASSRSAVFSPTGTATETAMQRSPAEP